MPMELGTLAKQRELHVLKYLKKHGISSTERIQIDLIKKMYIDAQRVLSDLYRTGFVIHGKCGWCLTGKGRKFIRKQKK